MDGQLFNGTEDQRQQPVQQADKTRLVESSETPSFMFGAIIAASFFLVWPLRVALVQYGVPVAATSATATNLYLETLLVGGFATVFYATGSRLWRELWRRA